MKRYLLIILSLLLVAMASTLSACDEPVDIENDPVSTDAPADDAEEESDGEEQEAPIKYWEIECYPTKSYIDRHFGIEGVSADVALSVSSEWSFEKSEDGYDILRGGAKIGEMVRGEADASGWSAQSSLKRENGAKFFAHKIIESRGEGKDTEFRYRFKYEFQSGEESCCITLTARYDEVDANAADALYLSSELNSTAAATAGALPQLQEGTVLILGNSFIGTSNVGGVLRGILSDSGKTTHAAPISRGYATVKTYIEDPGIMAAIEEGAYSGVFICGFYSKDEVENLRVLKAACDSSDTELIIFPAHNEQRDVINAAQKEFPELFTLDWKAEIDALIDSGIDRSHFCINDEHQHSTEIAGIVGAQMIYRAIYGEMPSYVEGGVIDGYNARDLLGSYLTDGEIVPTYEILYIG